jgi:lambda repressor-like predicted transcriptional regulator
MAGKISMSARREVLAAVSDRYLTATRREKGRILDELCATTGWHRKHVMRALSAKGSAPAEARTARRRGCKYDAIRDALTALWEASDRVCGKRLVAMIPMLLPSLERHGRLQLGESERALVLLVSAATIDRLLGDVKVAAAVAGGVWGSTLRSVARFQSTPSMTGRTRRLASARSTWWRTVALRSRAPSSRR